MLQLLLKKVTEGLFVSFTLMGFSKSELHTLSFFNWFMHVVLGVETVLGCRAEHMRGYFELRNIAVSRLCQVLFSIFLFVLDVFNIIWSTCAVAIIRVL